jgi:hypothetical protein
MGCLHYAISKIIYISNRIDFFLSLVGFLIFVVF